MFLIRADGNARIGAGHLMRCLTIADELRCLGTGEKILFVCADAQSAEMARRRGYKVFVLESDLRDMEGELSAWPRIPGIGGKRNIILVDSYSVTKAYLREIGAYGRVTLLDDLGEECFPVDRVVNYNAFADRAAYERLYGDSGTELILGSAYVPVRPQFRGEPCQAGGRAENLLITTGGGDQENIAGQILRKIREKAEITGAGGEGIKLDYHLVIGSFNPHLEEMKSLERQSGQIHIYHDVENMAELMRRCDLAVTAGGSTVYELAALGVPFVCFSYAENQEKITEYLQREGIAPSAGAYHKNPGAVLERLAEQVILLAEDAGKRMDCSRRGRGLTDGLGAGRLAGILAGQPEEGVCRPWDGEQPGNLGKGKIEGGYF